MTLEGAGDQPGGGQRGEKEPGVFQGTLREVSVAGIQGERGKSVGRRIWKDNVCRASPLFCLPLVSLPDGCPSHPPLPLESWLGSRLCRPHGLGRGLLLPVCTVMETLGFWAAAFQHPAHRCGLLLK